VSGQRNEKNDTELVVAVRAGDGDAWIALLRRHHAAIRTLLLAMLPDEAGAEEWTARTFLRCYRFLDRQRRPRPFVPWLHKVAINLALTELRREERRRAGPRTSTTTPGLAPERGAAGAGESAAGEAPSPLHRALLALRALRGWQDSEIAPIVGFPPETVRERLRAARAMAALRLPASEPSSGCGRESRELDLYFDSELPARARRRVERHLEGCAVCQQELDRLRAAQEALRRGIVERSASADPLDRLIARCADEAELAQRRLLWRREPPRPWWRRLFARTDQ